MATSQEIYHEFKRIRTILKKPVVISVGSMMTSGALYSAAGASHVMVNSGTLAGSIGVIFPLINMERLYDWAKVEPYSIKTGEFKDAGTKFRPMTSKERVLFQDLVNELLDQFKSAIMEGRKMNAEDLELYTDARVFTGDVAVSVGFADSIGTYSSAIEMVGEMSGLGKKPKLFTPQPSYFDLLSNQLGGGVKGRMSTFLEEKKVLFSLLGFLLVFGLCIFFHQLLECSFYVSFFRCTDDNTQNHSLRENINYYKSHLLVLFNRYYSKIFYKNRYDISSVWFCTFKGQPLFFYLAIFYLYVYSQCRVVSYFI